MLSESAGESVIETVLDCDVIVQNENFINYTKCSAMNFFPQGNNDLFVALLYCACDLEKNAS